MAASVIIGSGCSLIIEACCRKQPNKSNLLLYKPFNSHSKQLYTSNKMECFNYKGGCGVHGRCMLIMCLKEKLAQLRDLLGQWALSYGYHESFEAEKFCSKLYTQTFAKKLLRNPS